MPSRYRDRELQAMMPGVQTTIAKAADYDRLATALTTAVALLGLAVEAHRAIVMDTDADTAVQEEMVRSLQRGRDDLLMQFALSLPRCYTCRFCGSTSPDLDDIEQQYCRHCRLHSDGRERDPTN